MKLIILSTFMAFSLNVFAGVCCNSGGAGSTNPNSCENHAAQLEPVNSN